MQVQIAEEGEKGDWREERDHSIRIKTRPNYFEIASLILSAALLLGMLAAEYLPYSY